MIKLDDFRHMWRGKTIKTLSEEQAIWLKPYEKRQHHNDRALLLLHGFSSSPAVFRLLLPALSEVYGAVVSPALPGHATNISSFAEVKAHEWVAAAEDACSELVEKYAQVDVMGLSLGGVLACHLANRFSLHHLYLLAPALSLRMNISLALNLAKVLRSVGFKRLRNRAGNLHQDHSTEIAYRQLPIDTIVEILNLIKEFEFKPPQCPVDVFLGRYDEVVESPAVAEKFEELAHAKIHWLQNSAHVLPLDGDIELILSCIRNSQPGTKPQATIPITKIESDKL